MPNSIDLDRPYLMRKATDVNMKIYMYFDQPGVYLNAHGKEIPDTIAIKAGFDVKRWAKQKYKMERMEKFREQVEAELEADDDVTEDKVLGTKAGYKIIGRPLGLADVYDPDGEKLNERAIPVAEAELLMNMMAGDEE